MNIKKILGLIILTTLALAACQTVVTGPEIVIEDAWGRPSPKVAAAGAFYMVIKNKGGEMDRLVGGESPSCGTVELHETYDKGDGVMGIRPVEGGFIEIPAAGQTELKMGGFHIMCIEKLDDFEEGATLVLTLDFEKTGEIEVEMEIHQPDM
jgi:copper(I)-binding protein